MNRKNRSGGFTLVEVLIVLSIIQVFTYFGINHLDKTQDKQTFERWYKQFEIDVLYLQKQSLVSSQLPYIQFYTSDYLYTVSETTSKKHLFKRTYPNEWDVRFPTTKSKLTFSNNGQVQHPGTMTILTKHYLFTITFPFGKGRCYVNYTER